MVTDHELVEAFQTLVSALRVDENGLVLPREELCLPVPVRPASDRRGGRPGWAGSLRLAVG